MTRAWVFHAADSRALSGHRTRSRPGGAHNSRRRPCTRRLCRSRNCPSLLFMDRLIHGACAPHVAIDDHMNERRFARVARYEVMRLKSEIVAHTITLHLLDAPWPLAALLSPASGFGRSPAQERACELSQSKYEDIEPSDPTRKQSDQASGRSTTLIRFYAAYGSRSVERSSGRTSGRRADMASHVLDTAAWCWLEFNLFIVPTSGINGCDARYVLGRPAQSIADEASIQLQRTAAAFAQELNGTMSPSPGTTRRHPSRTTSAHGCSVGRPGTHRPMRYAQDGLSPSKQES